MERSADVLLASYSTPWGMGVVSVSRGRLLGVELPEAGGEPALPSAAGASSAPHATSTPTAADTADAAVAADVADAAVAASWVSALEAYFRGERLGWKAKEVPLEEMDLGDFERRVYRALLSVPPAVTVSYGTLAELAGYPRAARAVGNAMAANPIPVVIPCHRVVRSDGSLGRYGKDPAWKPRLLEHEAAHVETAT